MSNEFKDLIENGAWALRKSLKMFLDKYQEVEENTARSELSTDERSQLVILYQVQDKISDAYYLLKNLDKPVRAEGRLEKQSNGRYQVDGVELTSGSYVEFFDDDEDGGCYVPSRVEHNGEDYYIVALGREKSIKGLRVRIK